MQKPLDVCRKSNIAQTGPLEPMSKIDVRLMVFAMQTFEKPLDFLSFLGRKHGRPERRSSPRGEKPQRNQWFLMSEMPCQIRVDIETGGFGVLLVMVEASVDSLQVCPGRVSTLELYVSLTKIVLAFERWTCRPCGFLDKIELPKLSS